MSRPAGFIASVAVASVLGGAAEAAGDTPAETPAALTWRSETATFIQPGTSIWTEQALTFAGHEGIAREGLRLRVHVAANLWGQMRGRRAGFVETAVAGAAIGMRRDIAGAAVTGFAGLEHVRREGDTSERRTGAFGIAQIVWSPMSGAFANLYVAGSTARRDLGVTLSSGIATPFGFNLGPEAGVAFDRDGHTMRLGLAVTGITTRFATLSFSLGVLHDSESGRGSFFSAHLERRF